jgi:PAS domain S-box-containing protein
MKKTGPKARTHEHGQHHKNESHVFPHILVVEDEKAHQILIDRGFDAAAGKFRVSFVSTLTEARRIITDDPPALAFVDWLLPDGKGAELLSIRDSKHPLPIIIMTSHGDENLAVEVMKAGALDYLVKSAVMFDGIVHVADQALRECGHIAERRKAESALQKSEEKFRQLFSSMPSGVAIYEAVADGEDFVFRDFNAAGEAIEHIKKEEIIGRRVTEVFPGVKEFGIFSVFERVWKTGKPEFFPSAIYRDARDPGPLRENWIYRLPAGEVVAIYNDVTDRKKAEDALKTNKTRLDSAMDTGNLAWWEMDCQTGAVAFSEKKAKMLGYGPDRFSHYTDFTALLYPDDLEPAMQAMRNYLNGTAPIYDIEYRILTSSGEYRWFHDSGKITENNPDKTPKRVTGLVHDITERKRQEKALVVANQKLQLMNLVAWHDIQNKVTGLRGYVELLKDLCNNEQVMGYLRTEEEILKVIHQQIAYTKEYQQMGIHPPQWIQIRDSLQNVRMNVNLQQIQLTADVNDLEIFCDPVIERVFTHFIENSICHGQTVTEIRVSCRESATGLTIIYEDNGVGIPETKKKDLFSKSYGKIKGFDLFFVHDILEITDMGITETGEPGKGARFEITVPKGNYRNI